MGEIQFIANTDDWKAIKKLKVEANVPPMDIAVFLASVSISFDSKIEQYLKQVNSIKPIDDFLETTTKGIGKTEEDIAKVLKTVNSTNAGKIINACLPEEFSPKDKDMLKALLKTYLTRKAFDKIGFFVDYTKLPLKINK